MSDEKMVTEREAILRERSAAERALNMAWPFIRDGGRRADWIGTDAIVNRVAPLPKVTRPCVMTVLDTGGYDMRVIDGIPQYRRGAGEWTALHTFGAPRLTVNGARVLVALLANPTEEVDA